MQKETTGKKAFQGSLIYIECRITYRRKILARNLLNKESRIFLELIPNRIII